MRHVYKLTINTSSQKGQCKEKLEYYFSSLKKTQKKIDERKSTFLPEEISNDTLLVEKIKLL